MYTTKKNKTLLMASLDLGTHLHPDIKRKPSSRLFYGLNAASTSTSRKVCTFSAEGGDSFGPGETCRLVLPMTEGTFMDGANSFITGLVQCTGNGVRWPSSVHSMIQGMRITGRDGTVIENFTDYKQLHGIISDLTVTQQERDLLTLDSGFGSDDDRKLFASQGYWFSINLLSSFWSRNERLIPCELGKYTLELTFAPPNECLVVDSGTALYTFSHMALRTTLLKFSPIVDRSFLEVVKKRKVLLHAPTWATGYLTSAAQNLTMVVPNDHKSAKILLIAIRWESNISNPTSDMTIRTKASLDNISLQVGATTLDPISKESDFWASLRQAFDGQLGGILSYRNFGLALNGTGEKFIYGISLSHSESPDFLSGLAEEGSINVRITMKENPGANLVYQSWLYYDRILGLHSDGIQLTQ